MAVRDRVTKRVVLCAMILAGSCARTPWLGVLDGMQAAQITTELAEGDELLAQAPAGFVPAKERRWVLFFYDAVASPGVHAAFSRLAEDCFTATVPGVDDEPARFAAVCAFERVPPVPEGMSLAP